MTKKIKLDHAYTNYWKYPEEGFPQRINWVCIAGGGLSEIQEYDLVFDQKDIDIRFPKRNRKFLGKIL